MRTALPAVVALLALAGCSGQDAAEETSGSRAADVELTSSSLQEAAETLLLVDEAARRGVGPDLAAVVEEVRATQTADVEALTDLLEEWDEPVPETARDHANAGHGGGGGSHEELAGLRGAEFDEEWLDLMLDRHEAALDLAQDTVEEGQDADAVRLARQRVDRLEQQVAELERVETGSRASGSRGAA